MNLKMDNLLVSVVVTTYNVEKYIDDCLTSVLNQSYKNYEIIIVDDGSSDNTKNILSRYTNKYTNIRSIFQENSGVSVARNVGINESLGDFIMFVDGDDILQTNIINRLVSKINCQTDIVSCCCIAFDENIQSDNYFLDESKVFRSLEEKKILFLQLLNCGIGQPRNQVVYTAIGVPWGKLYRKKFILDNKLRFATDLRRMQDNVFNMYAFYLAKEIIYINEPLYKYRLTHIKSYVKGYAPPILYNILKYRKKFFDGNELYNVREIENMIFQEQVNFLCSSISYICSECKILKAVKRIKLIIAQPIYINAIDSFKSYDIDLKKCIIIQLLVLKLYFAVVLCFKLKELYRHFVSIG